MILGLDPGTAGNGEKCEKNMSAWSATSAHLVEQSTNAHKFEVSNPPNPGAEQK